MLISWRNNRKLPAILVQRNQQLKLEAMSKSELPSQSCNLSSEKPATETGQEWQVYNIASEPAILVQRNQQLKPKWWNVTTAGLRPCNLSSEKPATETGTQKQKGGTIKPCNLSSEKPATETRDVRANRLSRTTCNLSSEKPATETQLRRRICGGNSPAILVQRNQQLKLGVVQPPRLAESFLQS